MPTIHADSSIRDMLVSTLAELGRFNMSMIATRLQRYPVYRRLMRKKRIQVESGHSINRTIMLDHSGSARQVGLYEKDTFGVQDILTKINVPWRHTTANWIFERREKAMNAGKARILNLIETRRMDAFVSIAEHLEPQFWGKPDDSSDVLNTWGMAMWIPANPVAGFNGGNPVGFSSMAGLDTTLDRNKRFRSYTGSYAAVSKPDLIRQMRIARRLTDFQAPIDFASYDRGNDDHAIFVNNNTLIAMEELGEAQNENLGRDIASMDGRITFQRTPIEYVPYLDSDPTDPVLMVDFSKFYMVFLEGEVLRESEPFQAPWAHTVTAVCVDATYNCLCHDRRAQTRLIRAA